MNLKECDICGKVNVYQYQLVMAYACFEERRSLCKDCHDKIQEYVNYLYDLTNKKKKG